MKIFLTLFLYRTLNLRLKYINDILKIRFGLETTSSKSKPVAGPDDLLLLLVQHWARDQSVFPTEDDRHDVAAIMLFQSYTGCRPAELVHSSKSRASQDPLAEAEDTDKIEHHRETTDDYDDDSDAGDGPDHDDNLNYDELDTDTDDSTSDGNNPDSGYGTDGSENIVTDDTGTCYNAELDGLEEPIRKNCDAAELDEFGEPIRRYKALCYEDICLWIVRNPKRGGRDLLAMEVYLRHHKGADNKPKPCVALSYLSGPG